MKTYTFYVHTLNKNKYVAGNIFDYFSSAIKLTMSLLLVMMSATWFLQH